MTTPRRRRRASGRLAAALFLAATATACAPGPIVAPLRYEPIVLAPDEPFRARVPDSSPAMPAVSLPFRVVTLANGLRIAHLERRGLPIVAIRLIIERGAADVGAPIDTYSILAEMLDAGTLDRSENQLSAVYAHLGAARRSFFGQDGCGLSVKVGAESMDAAVALIAEVATRPRMSVVDFTNTRARWLADLANTGYARETSLRWSTRALLFGRAHAYGFARPALAHTQALRVEDIAALHARLFHPSQATLVVVGDATAEALDASVARWFGAWSSAAPPAPRASWPVPAIPWPRAVLIERRDRAHVDAMVFARGTAADEDLVAVEVLVRALGGLSSPLRGQVRNERGAAYAFGAFVVRMRAAFYAGIGGAFDPPKAMQSLDAILAGVRAVRAGGIMQDEVDRARSSLLAEWRARVSTNDGLSDTATAALTAGQPLEAMAAYPARLQAVTAADVWRAAQRYFGEDALRVLVLGDGSLHWELAQRGFGALERWNGYGEPIAP